MDAPKCKNCGERHYGLCPSHKSSRGGGESRPIPKPGKVAGSVGTGVYPPVKERRSQTEVGQAGVASSPREAKGGLRISPIPSVGPIGDGIGLTMVRHPTQAELAKNGGNWPPKRGRPRLEDRDKTLRATKPWLAAGMSRSSWYRRQREKAETKS